MKDIRTIAEKKQEILQHLGICYGIKTIALRKAKVGRTMFYEYLNSDPEFAFKIKEVEESFIDYVETRLLELISIGDRAAIMFYLKAKGKNRGYY